MADEPGNGELGRSLESLRKELRDGMAGINTRLDRVVSTEVYTLQSAHTDQRITVLGQDIQKVRDERDTLERDFERYQLEEARRRDHERQTRLYLMIIPVLLGLLSAAVAIWAVTTK